MTPQMSSSALLVQNRDGDDRVRIVPPAEVARELNQRFSMEDQNGLYFTIAYGVLDTETLEYRYVVAGHTPLVHVPHDGFVVDGVPSMLLVGYTVVEIVMGLWGILILSTLSTTQLHHDHSTAAAD